MLFRNLYFNFATNYDFSSEPQVSHEFEIEFSILASRFSILVLVFASDHPIDVWFPACNSKCTTFSIYHKFQDFYLSIRISVWKGPPDFNIYWSCMSTPASNNVWILKWSHPHQHPACLNIFLEMAAFAITNWRLWWCLVSKVPIKQQNWFLKKLILRKSLFFISIGVEDEAR